MKSKNDNNISIQVIKRLPRYKRYLEDLLQSGVVRISSGELAAKMGVTASQIRQDLNCFGGFGQQGYGYNIQQLHSEICTILGLDIKAKAILIGAGNLGKAIASHIRFENRGFDLIGAFDNNPEIIGTSLGKIEVSDIADIKEFCTVNSPSVAVLCIPTESAPQLVSELIELGIRGFWNFTHYDISLFHQNVSVENVHLSDSLMTLCYHINNKETEVNDT